MRPNRAWYIVRKRLDDFIKTWTGPDPVFYVHPSDALAFHIIFRTEHRRDYGCTGLHISRRSPEVYGFYKGIKVVAEASSRIGGGETPVLRRPIDFQALEKEFANDLQAIRKVLSGEVDVNYPEDKIVEFIKPRLQDTPDDFLQFHLDDAVANEQFKVAALIRDEAARRSITLKS